MATATLPRESGFSGLRNSQEAVSRLVVTWQHPETREISPIGLLSFDGRKYTFGYLVSAPTVEGFRPLLGFPEFKLQYRFGRIISTVRPTRHGSKSTGLSSVRERSWPD